MAHKDKKSRDDKKRAKNQRRERLEQKWCKPDIHKEVMYIIGRAQECDARCVTLNSLVLFSTQSRDAWLLDAEDDFALWLAKDGVPQPVRILDTAETFAIDWDRQFQIERDLFITVHRSGQVTSIQGYPIQEILEAIDRITRPDG
jgi:hypothetical protein